MSTGLLDFESAERRQGGVREYVSPSRLSCWLKCPRGYAFRYIEGIRSPTNAALFLGKTVHFALELAYRHRQLGITLAADEVASRLVESWGKLVDEEGMTFDSAAAEQVLQQQACGLVKAYLAYAPTVEKPLAVEVAAESPLVDPFSGEDLGMPLLGIMDLVLDNAEGPIIVDFKTSSRTSEPMEIVHEIQLTSYAYLFRQASPVAESGLEIRSLIKTKTPKVEFHGYPARTDAHFRRLFSVLREYLDALDSGRFNYRPGFGCGLCDVRSHCSRWAG
jgi:CRISPR/Cas system-associated exonuclease Cas4 (RecB family)